jgi:E3 ubiquitin-protein ligase HUWE1
MFWEILLGFDREMRANFLQFVTGTSKVPIDGFRSLQGIRGIQKFQIHKVFDNNLLPTSHTCMNQLDLPDYPSIDVMREKLIIAVTYGKEGFGFL